MKKFIPLILFVVGAAGYTTFLSDRYYDLSPNEDVRYINPCHYPLVNSTTEFAQKCNIEANRVRRYEYDDYRHFICNPQTKFSNNTVDGILTELDTLLIRIKHESRLRRRCACDNPSTKTRYCWFRIGIAFMEQLKLPHMRYNFSSYKDYCSPNMRHYHVPKPRTVPYDLALNSDGVFYFGQVAADIIRERYWPENSTCGEEILLLVVRERPVELMNFRNGDGTKPPYIFVSPGNLTNDRINKFHPYRFRAQLDDANDQLAMGVGVEATLKVYLHDLLNFLDDAQRYYDSRKRKAKIPRWAVFTFAGCGALLIIMALGSCLVRTGAGRRSKSSQQPGGGGGSRWKAGFAGGICPMRCLLGAGGPRRKGKSTNLALLASTDVPRTLH